MHELDPLAPLRQQGDSSQIRKRCDPAWVGLRLLPFVRLQRIEGLLHELSSEVFLVGRRELGVARHMDDAGSQNYPVGSHHFSNRQSRGDLHDRDACFLELRRDRSAAASAGSSRRSQDDRVDAIPFDFLCHFPAEAARIR